MKIPEKLPKIEIDPNKIYKLVSRRLKGVKGFRIVCEVRGHIIRE